MASTSFFITWRNILNWPLCYACVQWRCFGDTIEKELFWQN